VVVGVDETRVTIGVAHVEELCSMRHPQCPARRLDDDLVRACQPRCLRGSERFVSLRVRPARASRKITAESVRILPPRSHTSWRRPQAHDRLRPSAKGRRPEACFQMLRLTVGLPETFSSSTSVSSRRYRWPPDDSRRRQVASSRSTSCAAGNAALGAVTRRVVRGRPRSSRRSSVVRASWRSASTWV